MLKNRWARIGLLALAIFLINAVSRLISRLTSSADDTGIDPMAFIGASAVILLLVAATVFWVVRHPVGRAIADVGFATIIGALLCLLIGPFVGGNTPFEEGLEFFVGQFLQFLGLGAIGFILGWTGTVVAGKDWKGRGLKRYQEAHQKRTHRTVR